MRIKVTGYLDTDDLDAEHVDTSHETGLSQEGFEVMSAELDLQNLEFEAVSE